MFYLHLHVCCFFITVLSFFTVLDFLFTFIHVFCSCILPWLVFCTEQDHHEEGGKDEPVSRNQFPLHCKVNIQFSGLSSSTICLHWRFSQFWLVVAIDMPSKTNGTWRGHDTWTNPKTPKMRIENTWTKYGSTHQEASYTKPQSTNSSTCSPQKGPKSKCISISIAQSPLSRLDMW